MANHGGQQRYTHSNRNNNDTIVDVKKQLARADLGPLVTGGLEFCGLTYTVVKRQKEAGKWTSQEVDLLHHITGYAPKGCLTAVMGPSGAGKSTFLDGLAGRIASGSLQGRVSLDGTEMSPSLIKRTSAYIMQDDRLFPMLTVYETLMFAADFRLGSISRADKRERVEKLIEQLGLTSSRNTYIGDEGTRGVSGGERRRVSIGVDIIHGPALLFLDEPTSGLDSSSAHRVIERVHAIARSGSTVILTIHQPSYRIQMLLDHLIVLARGKLIYQGAPRDVGLHLSRMGRKTPSGENSIEFLLDVIREYDQSDLGIEPLAEFCTTGVRPQPVYEGDMSGSTVPTPVPLPRAPQPNAAAWKAIAGHSTPRRLELQTSVGRGTGEEGSRQAYNNYNHSWRTPGKSSWSGSHIGVLENLSFTPSRPRKTQNPTATSLSPGYYTYSSEILPGTPTPHSSDYTVDEDDYLTPHDLANHRNATRARLGPKFHNSFPTEVWILMRRNFINIYRTPELFLSRQMVLTVMGIMMATMFMRPKDDMQGITNNMSFFIFTVCIFFFSSNDAVPAFIQERFIFIRETSHNAYRASSYAISGLITYLPFLAVQAATYALIVWFALQLRGNFLYFVLVLYFSLLSTNSFVVFVSSVVPNYILGYAAVIAFTALFFLFCGYFLNKDAMPNAWLGLHYISTIKYPYEGLLINEYHTTKHSFDPHGLNITGTDILKSLAIKGDDFTKWEKLLCMLGWGVVYRILFYLVLRFASKNQRS